MIKIIREEETKENNKLTEDKMSDAQFYKVISRVNNIIQEVGQTDFQYGQVNSMRVELVKIENALTTIEKTIEKARTTQV